MIMGPIINYRLGCRVRISIITFFSDFDLNHPDSGFQSNIIQFFKLNGSRFQREVAMAL